MSRADFYVGIGKRAEYIGSCAIDCHPKWLPKTIISATSELQFRQGVASVPNEFRPCDITFGWPWSWDNSWDTNFTYAFYDNKVLVSYFGSMWMEVAGTDWHHSQIATVLGDHLNSSDKVVLPQARTIMRRLGLTKSQAEQKRQDAFTEALVATHAKFASS